MLFRKMLVKSLFARLRKSVRYVVQSRALQRISIDIQLGSLAFVVAAMRSLRRKAMTVSADFWTGAQSKPPRCAKRRSLTKNH
jgi:hypothetical protein